MIMRRVPSALLFCVAALPASAQEPSLAVVLERAAAYVAEFHRQLSGVVTEEQYVQDLRLPPVATVRGGGAPGVAHRALLSDLLLVKPIGADRYVEFRDVYAVDGKALRERSQRLLDLFIAPSAQTSEQAGRILAESARYNIGDVERNVNTPVFPLSFLTAENQPRSTFSRSKNRATKTNAESSADGAFRVSTEVWAIEFAEQQRDTLIKTGRGQDLDLPARGRFWIEPATGRVLMSELRVEDVMVHATINVSYQSEALLGLLVPIEMRERYENKTKGSWVDGRATYGRFRQFQVKVDEKLSPIVKQ
jgi:hypothetical protein